MLLGRTFRAVRRLHLYLGLAAALYFMLIAATGVALNHRAGLRLENRYVARQWLPSSYRPQDGAEVRADIVIGDLHSGLIFGRIGAPVMDVVATIWFLSLLSGLTLAALGRSLHNGSRTENGNDSPVVRFRTPSAKIPVGRVVESETESAHATMWRPGVPARRDGRDARPPSSKP